MATLVSICLCEWDAGREGIRVNHGMPFPLLVVDSAFEQIKAVGIPLGFSKSVDVDPAVVLAAPPFDLLVTSDGISENDELFSALAKRVLAGFGLPSLIEGPIDQDDCTASRNPDQCPSLAASDRS